jgi:SAM-dependent methyltransferase
VAVPDKGLDQIEIASLLGRLVNKLRDFREDYGAIYPGLFDGPSALPRLELVEHCQVLTNRLDIIRKIPKGGRFAEIGTLRADFAVKVIEINCPTDLHLFDRSFSLIDPTNRAILDAFGHVTYHLGDSSSLLSQLDDGFFDAVYVDGDHSYQGVWKDLAQALRVLKPDGYLLANDYTNWDPIQMKPYGVFSAINRFANDNNLHMEFLALQQWGFHDVALRRMSASNR